MTREDIQWLAEPVTQEFIFENETKETASLRLSGTLDTFPSPALVAQQITGRHRCREKLPFLYAKRGIVYPPTINIEQSSSEATAMFRNEWLKKNLPISIRRAVDLTGGFGIDGFFLSRLADSVDYVEPVAWLNLLAKHNHRVLGASNIHHHSLTAENFLSSTDNQYDLIYIDPSRRTDEGKKIRLQDCQPDVVSLYDQLLSRAEYLLIKASPLLDIDAAVTLLPNTSNVIVLSIDNECKELLFLSRAGHSGEPVIEAVNVCSTKTELFRFTRSEEKSSASHVSEPMRFLYEPNVAILKSGGFKRLGESFGLAKLHQHTHLYTSNNKIDFPGRVFEIIKPTVGSAADVPSAKANVVTRHFPLSSEALKKKLKLSDGGDFYVLGFTGPKKKHIVLATRIA